ncbi:MAG: DUF3089 domain-containing protein [Bacteroidales bacterium]|nr:DUF3089 domain-containing protein [Bacteroidales bacterium]
MRSLFLTLLALALFSCSKQPAENIYADNNNWFDNGKDINPQLADVFYILPTCVFDWTDSIGQMHHHASLTDEKQRAAMQPSYELADRIFADSANFFAPYYRHITMESWKTEDTVAERFPMAMDDIRAAFKHYLKEWNNGRPFILAGFSQGAKCVIELIKEMDEQTYSKFIAGYVCGYRVTQQDLQSKTLKPAQSSTDTGVAIVYNTVTKPQGINPIISGNNQIIINPASWTTDYLPHPLNDSISIQIDSINKVLIVQGIDEEKAFIPTLDWIFPKGNIHLQELTLYQEQLQKNVKQRINSFVKK